MQPLTVDRVQQKSPNSPKGRESSAGVPGLRGEGELLREVKMAAAWTLAYQESLGWGHLAPVYTHMHLPRLWKLCKKQVKTGNILCLLVFLLYFEPI